MKNMTFQKFNEAVKQQFALMCQHTLFVSSVSGDKLWDLYISNFPEGADPVFRDPNSTQHTCNNDKNFIRRYGNVVAIINNKVVSMFDTIIKHKEIVLVSSIVLSPKIRGQTY